MTVSNPRRMLRRAGAVCFTLGLTLVPLVAPERGDTARASQVETIPAEAKRIVSVGGSLTEIVYALGAQDRLVARDSTSTFPVEAEALPDVGYMRALSPEGVLSVQPDAILLLEGSGPPEAVEVLRKASVPMVFVPERFDSEGILAKIRAVGEALGLADETRRFEAQVAADLDETAAATADIAQRKRVLFVLSLQGGKILASGEGTAAAGILALAGAENAVGGFTGYRQLTDEAVIEAQPDAVLVMAREGDLAISRDELIAHPAIAATPAGQKKAVVAMDGLYLLGFGPRTAQAARDLAADLYGDRAGN
ncbi:ABC transporter substrate-binding protein [Aquibium sp. ELW1220]|jgi:iron complex transport system substrate-binding protein|uniref:heme/hemin ABC transporter substrate-binding protein n=1 Tax=Aquibium sp. ELW1220 TaxID=2976766 RepID=UPI0025AF3DEE|nr:ABC transporter substrate-binding protein [Aquibium sp. ELW1220]MDN2582269.1 ABC transporter substrate-binding protein [Aquibium sp. ELW1220]